MSSVACSNVVAWLYCCYSSPSDTAEYLDVVLNDSAAFVWTCSVVVRWCRYQSLSGDAKSVKVRDSANRLHVASSWLKHGMDSLVFIVA